MVYSIQNIETGEIDYVALPKTVECCCCNPLSVINEETGELERPTPPSSSKISIGPTFDEETGEPQANYIKRKKFHVPRRYFRGTFHERFDDEIAGKYHDVIPPAAVPILKNKTSSDSDTADRKNQKNDRRSSSQKYDFMNMDGVKNEIILGYNKPNYRLFLIPTLLCFNACYALMYVLVAVLEKILHMWAHKKNDLNMNKKVYFCSPLHIITSQFCARCRSEKEMDIKVFDMLNKEMRKSRELRALKDVSKVIS